MSSTNRDRILTLTVSARSAVTDRRSRLQEGLERRAQWLREDGERGAQAAEYAMLGGVSAAACGGLAVLLGNPETLRVVVDAVVDTLSSVVRSWF